MTFYLAGSMDRHARYCEARLFAGCSARPSRWSPGSWPESWNRPLPLDQVCPLGYGPCASRAVHWS